MDLNQKLDELLKRVKFATNLNLEQIEKRLLVSKGRLSGIKSKGQVTQRLLKNIENEFSKELNSLTAPGEIDVKPIRASSKFVDADSLLVHDSIVIKGMLRVMLRNQAEILASQKKLPVSSILKKMTKAVKDETQAEFDEL